MPFTLTGRVLNEKGAPLPGTVIMLKGSKQATITNAAGDFLLTLEESEPTLEFSCLGYQSQTLLVKSRDKFTLTMYPLGVMVPLAANDSTLVSINTKGLVTADVLPAFPGGPAAYRNFLLKNAHYPEQARSQGQAGLVYVNFTVDETGRILDPQILKGCSPDLDAEALRIVRIMPLWTPGLIANKPVAVAYTLRINFGLANQP